MPVPIVTPPAAEGRSRLSLRRAWRRLGSSWLIDHIRRWLHSLASRRTRPGAETPPASATLPPTVVNADGLPVRGQERVPTINLLEVVLREQEADWRRGERVPAEVYLERYPALKWDAERALDVIHNEFCLRRVLGEVPAEEEFCARFPLYDERLRAQFRADEAMERGMGLGTGAPTTSWSSQQNHTTRAAPAPPPPARPSAPAGFEIVAELGRGGMGVVFLAKQLRPERLVALKMLRAGDLAGAHELERFRREADALARLQHPNIVAVHHVDQFEGQPFLVMEYVAGGTLARRLARGVMPLADAARLTEVLARAAHAAHQWGIVHRDLKPENILLAACGLADDPSGGASAKPQAALMPKITDFGLAKRLDLPAETRTGAVMGTPAYMAPEQAAGRVRDIGPGTDVYALGAILYELLTGQPPFRGETTDDTLRRVRTEEPVAPRRLAPRLRKARDLETICLYCLNKEPHKRYATAEALADDLRRFLDGRPIRARRTPPWERAAKWARRKPAAAALLALGSAVALSLAVVIPAYVVHEHNRAERERQLHEREVEAHKSTRATLARLDRLVDDLTRWGQLGLADVPHAERVRQHILTAALEELEYLTKESGDDPALRLATGRAHHRVGDLQALLGLDDEAKKSYEAAGDLFAALGNERYRADACNSLGNLYRRRGQHDRARTEYERALAIRTELAERPDADAGSRHELAVSRRNLGLVLAATGKDQDALAQTDQAIALLEGVRREARSAPVLHDLAAAHDDRGNLLRDTDQKEAEQSYRRALKYLDDLVADAGNLPAYRQERGNGLNNRGILLEATGRPDEAENDYKDASLIRERLVEDFPAVAQYHRELLAALNNDSARHLRHGRLRQAEETSRKALQRAALPVRFGEVPEYRHEQARAHGNRATVLLATRRPADARPHLETAITTERALAERHPDVPAYALELARLHRNLGTLHLLTGRLPEAKKEYDEALAAFEDLPRRFPPVPDYLHEQATTLDDLGTLLRALHKNDEAETAYRDSRKLFAQLAKEHQGVPLYAQRWATVSLNLALLLSDTPGRAEQAEKTLQEVIALLGGLPPEIRKDPACRQALADAYTQRGIWRFRRLPPPAGKDDFRNAVKLQESVVEGRPGDPESRYRLVLGLHHLAELLRVGVRLDEETPPRRRALEIVDGLVTEFPGDATYRKEQAHQVYAMAGLLLARGKTAEAAALLRRRLASRPADGDLLTDDEYRTYLRGQFSRLAEALLSQRHPEAAAEVTEDLAAVRPALWGDAYVAAGYLARCVGALRADNGRAEAGTAELADCYASEAVQWLREAVDGAPARQRAAMAADLEKGRDFAALRACDDFRELLRRLQERAAEQKP